MELIQCFEPGCKHEVEYTCYCTSPGTLCCYKHFGKHMKMSDRTHSLKRNFVEPREETKFAIIEFLMEEMSKISKLKEKILESFGQCLLKSEHDIRELVKSLDLNSSKISNYFTKIPQTQKISKSEQDPILGLLSLQPGEAVEKLKTMIPSQSDWHSSEKLFCEFSEEIEEIIGNFTKDKFGAHLNKILFSIESTIEKHNKFTTSVKVKHRKIIKTTVDKLANIKDSIYKLIKEYENSIRNLEGINLINENKMSEKDLKDRNKDLLNSQIIKIPQDLIKNNKIVKAQSIQELRKKRSEILNRPNDPELEQGFRRIRSKFSSDIYADVPTLQQAYQDYTNAYRQKTSLYIVDKDDGRTNLIIYDTENDSQEIRIVETPQALDCGACIAQLPNGNLFCFGKGFPSSGISLIIDKNYRFQRLPSGTPCFASSAIYFNNSLYCFGGSDNGNYLTLSERFDLNEKRWIKLEPLPKADDYCNSVIFNGNIVISGQLNKNLLRYSIGSNTFATIPYDFKIACKILINAERLYLIECVSNGSIYESELSNDTVWRRIGDSIINSYFQFYLSYNKGGINIAYHSFAGTLISYFKFNLEAKILTKLD